MDPLAVLGIGLLPHGLPRLWLLLEEAQKWGPRELLGIYVGVQGETDPESRTLQSPACLRY